MKTFLNDLRNELIHNKVNMEEIEDIINDHREMIEEAIKQGLTEEQIPLRFGDPKILAKELANNQKDAEGMIEKEKVDQEDTDSMTLWKEFTPDRETLKINIKTISEDYVIQASPDDKIRVYYDGHGNIAHYELSYKHGELIFEAPKYKGTLLFMRKSEDVNLIFEIPATLHLVDCKLTNISGDLLIKNIETDNCQINTTSGDITIQSSNLGQSKWNTVSGDFTIKSVNIKDLSSSQVSGDLDMEHAGLMGDVHMNTVSGDLNFKDVKAKTVEFSSVSGDIEGNEFYPEVVRFKSVNGDLSINNKEKTNIHLEKVSTLSGSVDIN